MSLIHYFQRYSQKENVVTNNTLLLFSRIFNHSPMRFQDFLSSLFSNESIEISIGTKFTQQTGNTKKGSVPDGSITQDSFKILIETKLYNNYEEDQLSRHLDGFENEQLKLLVLINPEMPSKEFISNIRKIIVESEYNINFIATTFEDIISAVDAILFDYDVEMKDVLNDYIGFCQESNLLPEQKYYMRAITAGISFDENIEFGIYYDSAKRGFSSHAYVGLYKDKSVRAIGHISVVVLANLNKTTNSLYDIVVEQGNELTQDEERRIITIMHHAFENHGWDIYENCRFFLVDKFYETDYPKVTKYPIQRSRFFNLKTVLGDGDIPEVEEVAKRLSELEWR